MTNDVRQVVEQPALHQRAWDLLRQMRGHLADENLISDAEYVWLAVDAPNMTDPKGGSPAPRRLESYDETRERAEKAEAEIKRSKLESENALRERDEAEERWGEALADVKRLKEQNAKLMSYFEGTENFIERLTAQPAPSGWQPIETVPAAVKDGRDVLLLLPDGVRDVGRWFSMWDESGDGWWTTHALKVEPTHWMPLPPAPAQESKS